MDVIIQGQVGPQVLTDGTTQGLRQDKTGALVVTEVQPRYYELAVRGILFTATGTPAGGTSSSSSAGTTTLAAAGTPLGALYNPSGSGKNAIIVRSGWLQGTAGTGPGYLMWYLGPTAAITAGTALPINSTNGNTKPLCTAYGATAATAAAALTGASQINVLRPFWPTTSVATFGTTAAAALEIEGAGDIVVPPGSYAALTGTVAAATLLGCFSVVWAEVNA